MDRGSISFTGGKGESGSFFWDVFTDITNSNPINTLILVGCNAGSGEIDIAKNFASHLEVNRVIASNGYTSARRFGIFADGTVNFYHPWRHNPDPVNFIVFFPSGNNRNLNASYSEIGHLINAAGGRRR